MMVSARRHVIVLAFGVLAMLPLPALAQTQTQTQTQLQTQGQMPAQGAFLPPIPPMFSRGVPPLSDAESGGLGCLTASVAVGAGVVALMGGPAALAGLVAVPGVMTARSVLEASAAGAFVLSSACYIGQVLAPAAMLATSLLLDTLSAPAPSPADGPPSSPGGIEGAVSWLLPWRPGHETVTP
jgi:hypothetical protein